MTAPYRFLFDHLATHTDAERAHRAGFRAIRAGRPVARHTLGRPAGEPVERLGLRFPGVLGLAAGFDKNAVGIDALAALGFGFVEVGTVTGRPQPGNPRPRLFRLPADRAIVNRMGFNNDGAEVVAQRLAARKKALERWTDSDRNHLRRPPAVLGVNIGKTKVVPEAEAVDDYRLSTRLLAPYADYLVVNVSSPNTPGLRDLQAVEKLQPLLAAVRRESRAAADRHVPLLVKIAPDLNDDDVCAIADLVVAERLDGIVATNTTTSRDGLRSAAADVERAGAGGLSGEPLLHRSLEVLRMLRARVGEEPTLIGVGGIATVGDAVERLAAGADLLQAYTAFVYQGPTWPGRMNRALARRTEPALSGKDA